MREMKIHAIRHPSFFADNGAHQMRISNKKRAAIEQIAALNQFGAEEKTRTSTGEPPLDPEPSASTNSATSATRMNMLGRRVFVNTFFFQKVKNIKTDYVRV